MTHVTTTHAQESLTGVWHFNGLLTTLAQRLRQRRELNQLLSMSDHHLKDIGVQREDVLREAMKPLWQI